MVRCIIDECITNSRNKLHSLHQIPNEEARAKQWMSILKEAGVVILDNINQNNIRICSRHFQSEMLNSNGRLTALAYPSLLLSATITLPDEVMEQQPNEPSCFQVSVAHLSSDVGVQTPPFLSRNSPRENQLRRELKNLRSQLQYQLKKTKFKHKMSVNDELTAIKDLSKKHLPHELASLVAIQVDKQLGQKAKGSCCQ